MLYVSISITLVGLTSVFIGIVQEQEQRSNLLKQVQEEHERLTKFHEREISDLRQELERRLSELRKSYGKKVSMKAAILNDCKIPAERKVQTT